MKSYWPFLNLYEGAHEMAASHLVRVRVRVRIRVRVRVRVSGLAHAVPVLGRAVTQLVVLEQGAVALCPRTGAERARLGGLHAACARVDIAHDHENHLLAARLEIQRRCSGEIVER